MRRRMNAEFEYEFEWFEEEWEESTECYADVKKSSNLGIEVDSNYNFNIVYANGDEIPNDYEKLLDRELENYFSDMVSSDEELYKTYQADYRV